MDEMSRREWSKLAFGGVAVTAFSSLSSLSPSLAQSLSTRSPTARLKTKSIVNGVTIGAQSYSFRDRSLDDMLAGMVEVGISSCELWQGHLEPKELLQKIYLANDKNAEAEIRKFRLSTPLSEYIKIRDKFRDAGVDIYAYNYSFRENLTDEEIEQGFKITKALGAKVMTGSSNVSIAPRVDPFAIKYKMRVGMHNHSNIIPNEFATPDDFAKAMNGRSKYICVNLDIGHFIAAGFNPVEYLNQHHDRILTLHIKDRRKNQGENMSFGEGDTPIKEVLGLLRANRWPIPANIEYEYKGQDTITEMKKCFEYCRQALLA